MADERTERVPIEERTERVLTYDNGDICERSIRKCVSKQESWCTQWKNHAFVTGGNECL